MKALILLLFSSSAFATTNMTCKVYAVVNDVPKATKKITVALENDKANCLRRAVYRIPETQVDVTVYGHGDCDDSQGICRNTQTTVGGIEILDSATKNYSHTYNSCNYVIPETYLQMVSQGKDRVNVVVGCQLVK